MSKKDPAHEQEMEAREKAIEEREQALVEDLKKFNLVRSGLKDLEATAVASGKPLTLAEIGKEHFIEPAADFNPRQAIETEAFMNELVKINVYPDGSQGALEVIVVTVNGVNQPLIRGLDQMIKRKYVEALARSRVTNYRQRVADPARPENIEMQPMASLTYPFVVREDRNQYGAAWLKSILDQPM
jgi:hypothetical protein